MKLSAFVTYSIDRWLRDKSAALVGIHQSIKVAMNMSCALSKRTLQRHTENDYTAARTFYLNKQSHQKYGFFFCLAQQVLIRFYVAMWFDCWHRHLSLVAVGSSAYSMREATHRNHAYIFQCVIALQLNPMYAARILSLFLCAHLCHS